VTLIHQSSLPPVEIPELSVTDFVFRAASAYPDRLAMTDGADISYTFAELEDRTRRFAGGLAERGFGPGSCLALMAPNVPDYFVVFHGVATSGGTLTTINPTYGAEEVRFQLLDANATILVTVPMFLETATAAAEGTGITEIVVIGGTESSLSLDDYLGERLDQVPVAVHEDVMVLPYSSGTTGLPKGVMLTHYNLVANICQMEHVARYLPGEIGLAALPFFHIYGMQVLMNGLIANGAGVVTMQRFDMEHALTLVQDYGITRFYAVPPMVLGLAKSPVVDNYDLSSLKQIFSGAAPLTAELQEEAAARVKCQVVQGYGMTELSPVTHATPEGINRAGTSGLAISNVESRIVDPDTGQDQPVGERGELWVRGPMVMKGYLNNPEATAETIDGDGWLHTGDVAIVDDDGFFSIVDRIKELIKYKGFQVPPAELEGLIVTHPKILDVAVIGVPDDEAGELPKAFIVVAPGEEVTLEELQAFVAEHLVNYKQIRVMEKIDAIPKSASGKILRRELRGQ
jgi:acyl-CoA synthetase (AMP-forming)/AMP-acid ligase II